MDPEGLSESESSATSFNNLHAGLEDATPYGILVSLTAASLAELEARTASEEDESNRRSIIRLDHGRPKWTMKIGVTPPKDSDLAMESETGSTWSHRFSLNFGTRCSSDTDTDNDDGPKDDDDVKPILKASAWSKTASRQSSKWTPRFILQVPAGKPPQQPLPLQQLRSDYLRYYDLPDSTSLEHETYHYNNPFLPRSNHGPRDDAAYLPSKGFSGIQCIAQLNRVEWREFRRLRMAMSFQKFCYATDVLVGEPSADGEPELKAMPPGQDARDDLAGERSISQFVDRLKAANARMDRERGPKPFYPVQGALPERIRINSTKVLNLLKTRIGLGQGFISIDDRQPLVIVRPFRALVHCQDNIRDYCSTLEQKYARVTEQGVEETETDVKDSQSQAGSDPSRNGRTMKRETIVVPRESASNSEEELGLPAKTPLRSPGSLLRESPYDVELERDIEQTDEYETMRHLRCLLNFIDEDINARLRYLAKDEPMKITFPDIWYLFKPGDEVVEQNGRQAYRVLALASTGHKVIPPQNQFGIHTRQSDKLEYFDLSCVYIDFDGTLMGPVQRQFAIPRFDGQKLITSLPIYPLRFNFNSDIREMLIERGRLFPRYTSIRHMHYAGMSLDLREEVDGHVVIDFEEAVAKNIEWKPRVENLWGTTRTETNSGERCRADCCEAENVLDDAFVEQIRNDDYMTKLTSLAPKKLGAGSLPTLAIYPRSLSDMNSDENSIMDDEYLIMSNRVLGFDLHNRKWGKYLRQQSQLLAVMITFRTSSS